VTLTFVNILNMWDEEMLKITNNLFLLLFVSFHLCAPKLKITESFCNIYENRQHEHNNQLSTKQCQFY